MAYHVVVHATEAAVPYGATVEVEAACEVEAPVPTAIVPEDGGTMVEVVAVGVVAEYGEVPATAEPEDGAEEIIYGGEGGPLPVVEDVAQVLVAVRQVTDVGQVGLGVEREQIVEVDFVSVVVLLVVEVELVGHLVGEIVSTLASGLIVHGVGSHPGEEGEQQGCQILLHKA